MKDQTIAALRKDRNAWKRATLRLLDVRGWECPRSEWPCCGTCKCPGTAKQRRCALRWAKEKGRA